jgi:hypothetical protein
LTDDEYPIAVAQGDSDDAKKAVTLTVAQADGVKAAPMNIAGAAPKPVTRPMGELMDEEEAAAVAAAPAPKAAKAKAAPAADADDEPEVRKETAKGGAVPAKKSKLADIVSDWDDE